MRGWDFPVSIDPQASIPIFAQIAHAIAGDIRRGRLRAGEPMPGTRRLARTLGVNRNTVIAAYDDLVAEGWVTTENGRGTFVSRTLPDPGRDALPPSQACGPSATWSHLTSALPYTWSPARPVCRRLTTSRGGPISGSSRPRRSRVPGGGRSRDGRGKCSRTVRREAIRVFAPRSRRC